MSSHLSSEEISKLAIGDSTPVQRMHCRECAECGAELNRVQEALSGFRNAVWQWADQQGATSIPDPRNLLHPPTILTWRRLRWAPIAAVFAALTVVPLYKNSVDRKREAQAIQDSLLLERVNAQLSRTAPASLEPLMNLIADKNESNQKNRTEGDVR